APQQVNATAALTLYDVEMDGASVTLNKPLTVNNSLILTNGLINSSVTNFLRLPATATVLGGSATANVRGTLVRAVAASGSSQVFFPIGKGTAYRPVTLTVNHSSAMSVDYTAEVYNQNAQTLNLAVPLTVAFVSPARYFIIERQAVPNLINASVQLSYGADDGVSDPSNLRVVKTIGAALAWYDVGGSGTSTGSGTIASSPFTSFSTFALANASGGSNVLPVTLSAFTAECDGGTVVLNWTTESEQNTERFAVERSSDGFHFATASSVPAVGNSAMQQHYRTSDISVESNGPLYYRLKSIDRDSTFAYTNIVSVSCENSFGENSLVVYPNPVVVESSLRLEFAAPVGDEVTYTLTNMFGAVVSEGKAVGGTSQPEVPLGNTPSGVYLLTVETTGENYSKRVVVNRL
ncbi:MAG TPA: T9SS type A sorting domain-containing protein, partial [Chitinophagales bacterium]|nr:T9SS type A sorting domain-containing protein [Chitinophagales bacterium]